MAERPRYAKRSKQELAEIGITDYAILAVFPCGVIVFYTKRLEYTWSDNKPESPLHLKRFDDYESAFAAVVNHVSPAKLTIEKEGKTDEIRA